MPTFHAVDGQPRADLGRDVHHRHEVELHAAERLGLVEAEQPGLVQELLVLADEHARVLGLLRALAQDRHDLARPAHGLVVADGGEVAPLRLRQRADGMALLTRAGHDPRLSDL